MSRHKDMQPDRMTHTYTRPRPYRTGHVWQYTAQMENDNGITADLTVWGNDGKQLFSGRVAQSIASTALSGLAVEKRAKTLDEAPRQMVMDMARTARRELEKRLDIALD